METQTQLDASPYVHYMFYGRLPGRRSIRMVFAFDTLAYSRYLRDRGVVQDHAEAHAEAARQFIMAELVTKTDLQAALQVINSEMQAALQTMKAELQRELVAKPDLQAAVQTMRSELQAAIAQLDAKVDALLLRLTVRLGTLLAAGIAVLATLQKLG